MPVLSAFLIDKRLADFKNSDSPEYFPASAWITCTAVIRTDDRRHPAPGVKVALEAVQGLSTLVVTAADGNLLTTSAAGVMGFDIVTVPTVPTDENGNAVFKVASQVARIYELGVYIRDGQEGDGLDELFQPVVFCTFDGSGTLPAPFFFGESDPIQVPALGALVDTYAVNADAFPGSSFQGPGPDCWYAGWVGDPEGGGQLVELGKWQPAQGVLRFRVPYECMDTTEDAVNAVAYLISPPTAQSLLSQRLLFNALGTAVAQPNPDANPGEDLSIVYFTGETNWILTIDDLNRYGQLVFGIPNYKNQCQSDKIAVSVYLNGWLVSTYQNVSGHLSNIIAASDAGSDTRFGVSYNLLQKYSADPEGRPGRMYICYQVNDALSGPIYSVGINFSGPYAVRPVFHGWGIVAGDFDDGDQLFR